MILGKALILKGLAGVTVLGGAVTIGVVGKELGLFGKSIDPVLKELIEKVGLSGCTSTDSGSNECDIGTTGLKVKHESGSGEENKTKQNSDSETSGKIKVYSDNTYSNKFKFVIEEGDISLTGGSGSTTITKLEQFETYEIKEEGENTNKKWYFSRKKKAGETIKESLGLPDGCDLTTSGSCTDVEVNSTNIGKIKFDGLTSGETASLTGNTKLTVSKETTTDSDFPFGYKFTLKAQSTDATIKISDSKSITIKTTNPKEFKIKKSTGNNITLEEAWTATSLGEKVGLICPDPSGNSGDKKCTFTTENKINVKNDSDKIEGAKVKDDASSKKMTYEEDKEGYNQGFKFYTEEDITLTCNGTGGDTSGDKTINKKGDNGTETYYEIKKDESDNKWYLTKKTNSGSSQ